MLNNPLRYTDPTGMFSEDEIMKYYGVSTWDEVLALYEKGGRLEGLWGWLETLRRAELGDRVTIWDRQCTDPRCNAIEGGLREFFSGVFAEQDGQLVILGGTIPSQMVTFSADAVALIGRMHYGYSTSSFLTQPIQEYYRARWRSSSEMDWLGVGLDAGGIVADLVTSGAGGRVVNGIQVAKAAREAGDVLDAISLHKSGYALAVSISEGAPLSDSARDVMLDLVGLGIPLLPDIVSLWYGLFRWSP